MFGFQANQTPPFTFQITTDVLTRTGRRLGADAAGKSIADIIDRQHPASYGTAKSFGVDNQIGMCFGFSDRGLLSLTLSHIYLLLETFQHKS